MSDDDILKEAREAFERAADAEAENRREALDDLRFARLGEQWPEAIRRERELDGRPCLTLNRLPAFIRQVVNDARQNKGTRLLRSANAAPGADPQSGWRLPPGIAGMSPRLLLILGAVLALMVAATGLYWKGRLEGAAHERPRTEAALAQAAVSGLETEGARASAQRVDVVVRQRDATAAVVAQLSAKALTSEDANAPLDLDRAARLRAADDQLCLAAPDLAGCSAGGDADRGDAVL